MLSFGQEGESVGMLNGLWGVAVNDRDQIALTEFPGLSSSTTGFQCLEVNTHLRSFGGEGERNGEFNQPSGIAFDSHANSERSEFSILSRGKRENRKQSAIRL